MCNQNLSNRFHDQKLRRRLRKEPSAKEPLIKARQCQRSVGGFQPLRREEICCKATSFEVATCQGVLLAKASKLAFNSGSSYFLKDCPVSYGYTATYVMRQRIYRMALINSLLTINQCLLKKIVLVLYSYNAKSLHTLWL